MKGADACAVIGTLGTGVVSSLASTGMTTPDAVLLQSQLRTFADQKVSYVAMEASSIGIEEHRLDGTQVRVAVFTNLTQDHLDYHGDMTAYGQAKARLFAWAGLFLFFVKAAISKDILNIVTIGFGFVIQAGLMALILFK